MDRFDLFATPVFVFALEGTERLDRELCERLVEESARAPGLVRSNSGGWHSIPDLAQRREPCFCALMEMIVHHVQVVFEDVLRTRGQVPRLSYRFGAHAWAMVMRDGDYTILHDHAESHWSAVYYADAGDADESMYPASGRLAFVGPGRGGAEIPGVDLFPGTFSVRPQTGMLVIFPGALQHYVHPYRGTRPRVSVSCNIRMEPDGELDED